METDIILIFLSLLFIALIIREFLWSLYHEQWGHKSEQLLCSNFMCSYCPHTYYFLKNPDQHDETEEDVIHKTKGYRIEWSNCL